MFAQIIILFFAQTVFKNCICANYPQFFYWLKADSLRPAEIVSFLYSYLRNGLSLFSAPIVVAGPWPE